MAYPLARQRRRLPEERPEEPKAERPEKRPALDDPILKIRETYRKYYPEFTKRLQERRQQLIDRAQLERDAIDDQVMGSPGDVGDASVVDLSADYYLGLADRDRNELMEIMEALDRIIRGVYGVCENCEREISLERLRRQPTARLCIECQSAVEEGQKTARIRTYPKL